MKNTTATLTFQQTEKSHLNGVFKNFVLNVTENRRDGVINNYTCYIFASNKTFVPNVTVDNSTAGNLTSTGNWTVVNGTVVNETTQYSKEDEPIYATAQCSLVAGENSNGSAATGSVVNVFSYQADHFSIELTGLLPYTIYTVYISTCTRVGCGPKANVTFTSDEYSKCIVFPIFYALCLSYLKGF